LVEVATGGKVGLFWKASAEIFGRSLGRDSSAARLNRTIQHLLIAVISEPSDNST